MKTFWDLDEREIAALTDEQVRHFIDIELMTKGIESPAAPPPMPEIKTTSPLRTVTLYGVGGILFDTAEQANSFLQLKPRREKYDYNIGYRWKFPETISDQVKPEVLYNADDIAANAKVLAEHDAKSGEVDTARTAYENARKIEADTAAPIWKARTLAVATAGRHEQILSTYDQYLSLAENDERTAFRFLLKTFGSAAVEAAFAWAQKEPPSLDAPVPAEDRTHEVVALA